MDGVKLLGVYEGYLQATRSPATVRARTYWPRRALHELGEEPETVTVEQYEHWLGEHPAWSQQTRRMAIIALRQFHAWCVAEGLRDDDPTARIRCPSQPKYRARPIPEDVLDDAQQWAAGDLWWLLHILATTGLRRSEVANLRASDVSDGWLTVRGKGGRVRRVPVPPDVERWVRGRSVMWPDAEGRPLSAEVLAARVRQATRGWGPHSIRHRYATTVYARTHDVLSVQQLLGHSSLATTQGYLSVNDDELRSAASAAWAA